MQISFVNESKSDWMLNGWNATVDAYSSLGMSPGFKLEAEGGEQVMKLSTIFLHELSNGTMDFKVSWYEPVSRQLFGVRLHIPVQVLMIGKAPYWYVWAAIFKEGHSPETVSRSFVPKIGGGGKIGMPSMKKLMDELTHAVEYSMPEMRPNDGETSMPYVWECFRGYKITGRPSASHDNLDIEVVIGNKA